MLTKEQNDLLTQTSPGTPGGDLLRGYWQPIAVSSEMPPGGAPRPLGVMGEELVLFRDEQGRLGLLGLHCPHRGSDLSYGRLEDGGLRCLYHGWLFDVAGKCLEQPAEPAGSDFCAKINHLSYPCHEQAGIIFTYMGGGEPPLFPNYELFDAPESHIRTSKVIYDCNYLQGLEGTAADPAHTSFVHKQLGGDDPRGPQNTSAAQGTNASLNELYGGDPRPTIETEETDFGLRIFTVRHTEAGDDYVRMSNYVYPNIATVAASTGGDGYNHQVFVPIDDKSHWKWTMVYRRSAPHDGSINSPSASSALLPDGRLKQNASIRYGQNRESMKGEWFSGFGPSFNVHDAFATETQGRIQDRTQEHLGYSDKAIAASRRVMLSTVNSMLDGNKLPHVIHSESDNSFPDLAVMSQVVPAGTDWRSRWRELYAAEALVPARRGS